MNIRFVKQFVLFTIETYLDDGKMRTRENQYHIQFGESYPVKAITPGATTVDIEFPEKEGNIRGIALNVSKDLVETMQPPGAQPIAKAGCGGCGKGSKNR